MLGEVYVFHSLRLPPALHWHSVTVCLFTSVFVCLFIAFLLFTNVGLSFIVAVILLVL